MYKLILFLAITVSIVSCKKNQVDEYTGLIKDYTGLDGCGLMIDLDNGNRLEPVKNSSGIILEKNKRVVITYKSVPAASICLAGETVEIVSLRYL